MNQSTQPFSGVLAPILTPFNDDLSPAADRFVEHARACLDNGCTGLAPFGTTSEANSLGLDERMSLLEALCGAGLPAEKLMPGTGTTSLPDTIRLTRHAVDQGCGGVLLLPPFYYKGVSDEGLFRYVAAVIEGVGAEALRIYCYHIPPVAVVGYSTALLTRLAEAFPGIIVGTKDSSSDWGNTLATHAALPGFGTFVGSEKFLLRNLLAGGVGCITATANINAGPIRALYDGWQGENANDLDAGVRAFRAALDGLPVVPAMKWLIAESSSEPRWRNVRPPFEAFAEDKGRALLAQLDTGFGFSARR